MSTKKAAKATGQKPWRNRIIGHEDVNPSKLLTNPRNYKAHPDQQRAALADAIAHVGFVRSVTVNKRTGLILDGHLRVALAMEKQQPTIAVEYVNLTTAEETSVLATLDPISGLADVDQAALDKLLKEIGKGPQIEDLIEVLPERQQNLKPYKKAHVLISFAPHLASRVGPLIEKLAAIPEVELEQSAN